jgi:Protein of unknown function (DUF3467)
MSKAIKGAANRTVTEKRQVRHQSRTLRKNEEGRYANFFQIGHNAFEFLLEFGQQEGKIHTRIYVSPPHARMLCDLLSDTLAEHARIFGAGPESSRTPS